MPSDTEQAKVFLGKLYRIDPALLEGERFSSYTIMYAVDCDFLASPEVQAIVRQGSQGGRISMGVRRKD